VTAGNGVVVGALIVGVFWTLFGLVMETGVRRSDRFEALEKLDAVIRSQAVVSAGLLTIAGSTLVGVVVNLIEVFR
jgi:hypothetical protein